MVSRYKWKLHFNTQVINAWLHHYSQPTVRLLAIKTFIPAKSSKEDFTAAIPGGLNEFRVSWIAGDQAHESLDYGHAVCVQKDPTTNKWYLLDSERPKPIEMNTAEWAKLRGTVEVLQKGSAYNHGMIWNTVQDGYPQFKLELSYIHAKDVHITSESNAPRRLPKHNRPEEEEVPWDEVRHGRDKKRRNRVLLNHEINPRKDLHNHRETQTRQNAETRQNADATNRAHETASTTNETDSMHKMPAEAKHENNQRNNATSSTTTSKSSREKVKDKRKHLKGRTAEWRDKSKPADNQMNISYQRDTKKAKTQGHQTTALPSIKGMCWNVRGLATVLKN